MRLSLARLVLIWEVVWPAFWPLLALAGLFVSLVLFDILPQLPAWLHVAILLGLGVSVIFYLIRGFRVITWPDPEAARRRLERDSGLEHRPLQAIDDNLASNSRDHASVALWYAHRERMRAIVKRLRLRGPRIDLARVDPLALRTAVMILLAVALVVGLHDWRARLNAALSPQLAWTEPAAPTTLDAWVNPPAYTGVAPVFLEVPLSEKQVATITVPVGSELQVQVQGGSGEPLLTLEENSVAFEPVAEGVYRIKQTLEAGTWFAVSQSGQTLGTWLLELLPDQPPTIAFASPPDRTLRSILRLDYEAADDYGLRTVEAEIKRIDKPGEPAVTLSLPVPQADASAVRSASYHDLTPHPWAGLAVEIQLTAKDDRGQTGKSDVVRTLLPERIFNHPVARALVALRKELTLNPGNRHLVVSGLKEINRNPAHYNHDFVVFLAVRTAERRLLHDLDEEAVAEVQQVLWDTALHIEEGELAMADRELRELQEALMRALAEGAPQEEIDRLMEEMSRALDQFMEALAKQMAEQLAEGGEMQPLPEGAELITSNELQEMLDQARELARNGAHEAAQELLAQLQQMLENMRLAPFAQMNQGEGENAMEMMRNLEDILRNQQDLLDRSFQRSQQGDFDRNQPGGQPVPGEGENSGRPGSSGLQGDAQMQEQLRQQLGELMQELAEALGDIPRPLGRAEQAMRAARDALRGDQPNEAFNPQTRAVDQLQQGLSAMVDQFMERLGQNPGQRGQGQVGSDSQFGRDPLGRADGEGGFEALEGVEIPNASDLKRAGEILNELRRRRGERSRPSEELEYIDRLLRQF